MKIPTSHQRAARNGTVIFLIALAGCSLFADDSVRLDGPYADYHAFANAELPPRPPISGRYIHFEGTRYILSARIDCRNQPVDSVSTLELLLLPAGVDVREWIQYHHADFGNEYAEIEPIRHRMLSGSIRVSKAGAKEETRFRMVHYRLEGERLVFEGGVDVPFIQTDELVCYVGYGED